MSLKPTISVYLDGQIVDCRPMNNWPQYTLLRECIRMVSIIGDARTRDVVREKLRTVTTLTADDLLEIEASSDFPAIIDLDLEEIYRRSSNGKPGPKLIISSADEYKKLEKKHGPWVAGAVMPFHLLPEINEYPLTKDETTDEIHYLFNNDTVIFGMIEGAIPLAFTEPEDLPPISWGNAWGDRDCDLEYHGQSEGWDAPCPCGSGRPYGDCHGIHYEGIPQRGLGIGLAVRDGDETHCLHPSDPEAEKYGDRCSPALVVYESDGSTRFPYLEKEVWPETMHRAFRQAAAGMPQGEYETCRELYESGRTYEASKMLVSHRGNAKETRDAVIKKMESLLFLTKTRYKGSEYTNIHRRV